MDQKENCSQCDKEFSKKHLSPIVNYLAKNKTAFRQVFENENSKFCRTCGPKWLELGKIRGDKVEEFIENMTLVKKNKATKAEEDCDNFETNLTIPGPSGIQNNVSEVTSAKNDQIQVEENQDQDIQDSFLQAKKERDHWYKLWITGFCSDETGDEYMAKMDEYGRKWKESERKMNESNPNYKPLV